MAEASIPVDLLNPGQIFACLGFLEAAEILVGNAEGGFDWSDETATVFVLAAKGDNDPFLTVLTFLNEATAVAISPSGSHNERDGGATMTLPGVHPCRFHDAKGKARTALLPIRLTQGHQSLDFDYWCDLDAGRPILRLWTATNGNSAYVRFSKLLRSFREQFKPKCASDPLNLASGVAANFRLELRRNWTALNLGFSPDKISKSGKCVQVELKTYPVVELLAALGLSHARPQMKPKDDLHWNYSVWSDMLPVELARAAISQKLLLPHCREFCMELEEPNDGGDLSIAHAREEHSNG